MDGEQVENRNMLRDIKGRFIKGNYGFWLNKKRSEETKEKIKLGRLKRKEELGYIVSPEARKKISEAHRGYKLTDETKKMIKKSIIFLLSILIIALIVEQVYSLPGEYTSDANTVLLLHFNSSENATGEVYDSSFYHNNLTGIYGDSYYTSEGKYAEGFELDGVGDRAQGSNFVSWTGNVSIEAWIKPFTHGESTNTAQTIFASGGNLKNFMFAIDNNARYIIFRKLNETGDGHYWCSLNNHVADSNLDDGEWHHIAGTYNGSTIVGYVDGYKTGSYVDTTGFNSTTHLTTFRIGSALAGANYYFNGTIDEVRIYNQTLLPSDFNLPPTVDNVTIYPYPFYSNSTNNIYGWGRYKHPIDDSEENSTYKWFKNGVLLSEGNMTQRLLCSFDVGEGDGTKDGGIINCTLPITVSGATKEWDGKFDDAFEFNGITTNFIKIKSTLNEVINWTIDNFTVMGWGYFKGVIGADGDWTALVTKYNSIGQRTFQFGIWNNKTFVFKVFHNGSVTNSTSSSFSIPSFNQWHHYAGVWNGTSTSLYINGELVHTNSKNEVGLFESTAEIYIGRSKIGDSHSWNGTIDDVAIYKEDFSAERIKDIYERGHELFNNEIFLDDSNFDEYDNLTFEYTACSNKSLCSYSENSTELQIRNDIPTEVHPQLFFRSGDINSLREKITQTQEGVIYDPETIWDNAESYCQGYVDDTPVDLTDDKWDEMQQTPSGYGGGTRIAVWIGRLSFCAIIDDYNETYINYTRDLMLLVSQWDNPKYSRLYESNSLYGLAVGYDMIYDNLTIPERNQIKWALLQDAEQLYNSTNNAYGDDIEKTNISEINDLSHWQVQNSLGFSAVAMLLDNTTSYDTDHWLNWTVTANKHFQDYSFDNDSSHFEPHDYYYIWGARSSMEFMKMYNTSQGVSLFDYSDNINKSITWSLYHTQPNKKGGMTFDDTGATATLFPLYTMVANYYGNTLARWMADEIWSSSTSGWYAQFVFMQTIIDYDNTTIKEDPDTMDLPLGRIFKDFNRIYFRTGFNDSNDIVFATQSGIHGKGHGHPDAGDFEIWAYGEQLIDNHPEYTVDGSAIWHWFRDGISENIILINGENKTVEPFTNSRVFDRNGEVDVFLTSNKYSFVTVDPEKMYDNHSEIDYFKRNFLMLRGDEPYFIIIDDIQKNTTQTHNYELLLHADNQSTISNISGKIRFTKNGVGLQVEVIEPSSYEYKNDSTIINPNYDIYYDFARINSSTERKRGQFFTVLYPKNSSMSYPTMNSISDTNLIGVIINEDTTLWHNTTSLTSYTFGTITTNAEIVSFTNNSNTLKRFFIKNGTTFEDTANDFKVTLSDYTGDMWVKTSKLNGLTITASGNNIIISGSEENIYRHVTSTQDFIGIDTLIVEDEEVWFTSSSTNTIKYIASNLSDTIDATVIFNVDNCLIDRINYYPDGEIENPSVFYAGDWSCSDNKTTLDLEKIKPATASNKITIDYGGPGGGSRKGVVKEPTNVTPITSIKEVKGLKSLSDLLLSQTFLIILAIILFFLILTTPSNNLGTILVLIEIAVIGMLLLPYI